MDYNFVSTKITFGKTYNLGRLELIDASIDVSMKLSEGFKITSGSNVGFNIKLDESGKLTAECQNEILKVSKAISDKTPNMGIQDKLENLAYSVKSGYVTTTLSNRTPFGFRLTIEVQSNDLLPKDDNVDANVNCEINYNITFHKNDGSSIDWAVYQPSQLEVIALCIILLAAFATGGVALPLLAI